MIQAFSTSRFVAPKSTMISPQESPSLIIRGPRPADERDWRRLWFGYCSFYDTAVPEDVTAATWDRMLAAGSPLFSASPTGTAKSQASHFGSSRGPTLRSCAVLPKKSAGKRIFVGLAGNFLS
jgi:hypothetical protein